MKFIKEILENTLNSNLVHLIVDNNYSHSYYLEIFESSKWKVEMTTSMFDECYKDDKSFDLNKLFELIVLHITSEYHININVNAPSIIIESRVQSNYEFNRELNSKLEQLLRWNQEVLILGERQSGKTEFVKSYFSELDNEDDIFWLDFNGGYSNFVNAFCKILNKSNIGNTAYIILDNLECCGFDLSKNIYKMFSDFVKNMNDRRHDTNTTMYKLIILQNNDMPIIEEIKGTNSISFTRYEIYCGLNESYMKNSEIAKLTSISLMVTANSDVNKFLDGMISSTRLDSNQRKLLLRVLILASYDVKTKLYIRENEIKTAQELIKNVQGLKLYRDNTIMLSSSDLSKKLMKRISEKWVDWKFCDDFHQVYSSELMKNIRDNYYENVSISLNDLEKILASTTYDMVQNNSLYKLQNDNFVNVLEFNELIEYARIFKDRIVNEIQCSFQKGEKNYFGGHLGTILFAAEALTFYSDDWNALSAWKKLADYIYETYYIEGQDLPEIRVKKHKDAVETTRLDFESPEFCENSIKAQMELQDLVLQKYGNQIPEEYDFFSDENYRLFLTENQRSDSSIDFNKFYRTYILALLFEFEVTAPDSQRNEKRIKTLFNKIKYIASSENEEYFYPARVPWVTARMLLALSMHNNKDDEISRYVSEHQEKLCNWLASCSFKFFKNGTQYNFWTPGTGLWNSVLETTMICTFALRKFGMCESEKVGGQEYIKCLKENWFTPEAIADGIWACETIGMDSATDFATFKKTIMANLKKIINDEVWHNEKNDRSLGYTHIAKTLMSLLFGLSKMRPRLKIFGLQYDQHISIMDKNKIFISFRTSSDQKIAQDIYDGLRANERNLPYIYLEDMSPGNWPKQLKNAIRQADTFILVLSQGTLLSDNVQKEIKIGLEARIPFLPVVCDDFMLNADILDCINRQFSNSESQELLDILNPEKGNLVYIKHDNYLEQIEKYIKKKSDK